MRDEAPPQHSLGRNAGAGMATPHQQFRRRLGGVSGEL
jgi:hypothetical protein